MALPDLAILYEDAEALVIDKPAGLPVDPPRRGGPSLADRLDALKLGFARLPIPVHRLDTDTSGCLLLARNPKAMPRFARAFEERRVTKTYLGILSGRPEQEAGTINMALGKVSSAEAGWRMVPDAAGKPSRTHWRLLAESDGLALVRFMPETGRTHQLRVHAASGLGVPLLGDPVYGAGASGRAPRTMLHALALVVPRENKPTICATAPLPEAFVRLGFAGPYAATGDE